MATRLGRYEIVRRVASGGMATVYLGRVKGEGGFERLLAIKVMHEHLADDPEFVGMFLDEARLAASIRHPNVVSTIDVQRGPRGLFLVMDFVDGPTLNQLLKELGGRQRWLDLGTSLRILLDLLAGLEAAHELLGPDGQPLNLVHRDVSPSNVLVGADGITRITDFGVARAEARISSTRGKQLKGKLPYMAPEQLGARPVDRRADVYAAGCLLWEMLTARRLFRADTEAAIMALVLEGPQTGPRQLRPDVPVEIDRTCMRALERVERRYPSAAAFAEAIERAASGCGVRIATPREVARLVRELGPPLDSQPSPAQAGLPGSWPSVPSCAVVSALAPLVPEPVPPAPAPVVASQPWSTATPAVLAATAAPSAGVPADTNPTTNSSVMAPAGSAPAAPTGRLARLAAIALGAAAAGGLVVWLASRGGSAPPEVPSPAPSTGPAPAAAATGPQAPTAVPSASVTSSAAVATAVPIRAGPAPPRPRPYPRPATKPAPRPAHTATEFRPSNP
ncbi:MAG: serine/threonine protein kinase [Deltaproteobacteria bacterium]|nr:serine/threonine protein kinase [Deltaproteobacteria bacterium]